MQPLPLLTADRLAILPAGTRLKMGGHIVKLVGRGSFTNAAGVTQSMVEYIDSRGVQGSFEENIFLSTATEHLNAVRCEFCGVLRHPTDCVKRAIHTYMTTRQACFCEDKGCAEFYFAKHSNRQKSTRRAQW